VKEALEGVHAHEHSKSEGEEHKEQEEELKSINQRFLTMIVDTAIFSFSKPIFRTCSRKTEASCEWARDRAQRRR